jgi:hypothetical protein
MMVDFKVEIRLSGDATAGVMIEAPRLSLYLHFPTTRLPGAETRKSRAS